MPPVSGPVQPSPIAPPGAPTGRRGPLRRFLETRGTLGDFAGEQFDARVVATDGVPLAATYLPGPGGPDAIVIAHGFAGNRRKPSYARLADALADVAPVLAVDLRGHGGSGGWSTFGDTEQADVAGAVGWLRAFGHERVVGVGVSMGASAMLGAAAAHTPLAALVTISGPARWRPVAPPGPLRQLESIWHSPWRRAALRAGLGVRLGTPSLFTARAHPSDHVRATSMPLLVVHGADDAYFPLGDAHELVAASSQRARGQEAVVWPRPVGFGHGEDGFAPAFLTELQHGVVTFLREGRFPAAV
jgi:uncharacterized protein